ncbi:MAG: DUF1499 domain-containing protein [Myxococcales bacterium]|nr:DUF1499 domain-containing protein [Myxococcales bacterium]
MTPAPRRRSRYGRALRAAGVGVAVVVSLGFGALAVWPPITAVETGQTPEAPDVKPQAFRLPKGRVLAAAAESIDGSPHMELGVVDEAAGTVTATARDPWTHARSTVDVRVEANGDGGSIVFVRSASVSGRADFGANARIIGELQRSMADNLGVGPDE